LVELVKDVADCYALSGHPELTRRLRMARVKTFSLPSGRRWWKLLRFLLSPIALFWIIIRHRIDIVQINGFFEGVLLIVARSMGCVAISTRHITLDANTLGTHAQRYSFGWYIDELIYRSTVRFANKVVCVSASVGLQMRERLTSVPVIVIPNWIERVPSNTRESFQLHRPAHILFVGRLEQMKGLHLLIAALKEIRKQVPDFTLTVVGDGDCRQELEQSASTIAARFEGYKPDPEPYYRDADVLVNPSLGPEGSSLVAMEAMAHGVPCLLSDLPVFLEITQNGMAGMIFRTGDVQHLRDQLINLLQDEALRQRYASFGYNMIRGQHTVKHAQHSYRKVFAL
jgi:glycosyltransferase involved in cell wall biosynthesis